MVIYVIHFGLFLITKQHDNELVVGLLPDIPVNLLMRYMKIMMNYKDYYLNKHKPIPNHENFVWLSFRNGEMRIWGVNIKLAGCFNLSFGQFDQFFVFFLFFSFIVANGRL